MLNGTTYYIYGLPKGATILRVHDVKEAMEAITLTSICYKYKRPRKDLCNKSPINID